MRFGNHFLPDNDGGRAMLTALLRFGLTDENAVEDAPWCAAELPTLRRQARRMKWRDVGTLISLTFEEWKYAELYVMRPIDKSESELEAWREEQRKKSWRKSKAKQRAREKREKEARVAAARTQAINPRQTAIIEILVGRGGPGMMMPVPELVKVASKSHAFAHSRYRRTFWLNGPPPNAIVRNLRDAVHETVSQLDRKRVIETYKTQGNRGPVKWVRMLKWWSLEDEQTSVGASDPTPRRNTK